MPFIDDSYISPKLKVKKISKTEKGVFAVKPIRKGEILAITGGLVIPYHRVVRLPKDIKKYCYYLENDFYICPFNKRKKSPDLYFNHSCDPNTGGEDNALTTVAIKKIKKGEEVTYDYRKDYWKRDNRQNPPRSFHCRCGSKNCAGIVRF